LIKVFHYLIVIAAAAVLFTSCVNIKGEFSFKNTGDDVYRKRTGILEIASNAELLWIYKFPGSYKTVKKFSVIYKKKELVWVDIKNYTDEIYFEKSQLFGSIKDLPAGEYELVIFNMGTKKITDSLFFKIYEADDDDDENSTESKP
jgi:hypothetical protein